MSYVEVTPSNIAEIMGNLGISEGMLLPTASTDLCKKINGFDCNTKGSDCAKYGLSGRPELVGRNRADACPLYRLHRIFNNEHNNYHSLYAPIESVGCEIEDI